MSHVFTDYVRALDPSGAPPDAESFEKLRRALRRQLARELRKRGLWGSPPSYLGIYGARHWDEQEPGNAGPDPLDELFVACYDFVFIRRLRHLLVHLRAKPSIDGLIALNVRHFLHETQKRHDPLGFRVFERVHAAVRGTVDAGALHVLAGDPRIRNDTVLGSGAEAGPRAAAAAQLEEIVRPWNDTLLPELVTARGKARQQVIDALGGFLRRLPEEGVESFRFRDLVDPIKNDVRGRWAARLAEEDFAVEEGGEGLPEPVALLRPDVAVEEGESFAKLVDCVTGAVERSPATAATRSYLSALWEFLRAWAAEPGGKLPSRRRLAGLLGIPRNRMAELFTTLGELLRTCREASFAKATVNPEKGTLTSVGVAMSQRTTEPEALRRRTGEARRRHAESERELRRRGADKPRPGDLFLPAATADLPVEWAVLEEDPGEARRLVVVPADASPMAGSSDLVVPETAGCGPLTLRLAFAAAIDADGLEPETRTDTLPPELVERARQKRREHAEGSLAATDSEQEVDAGAEYREWVAEVLEPARTALAERRVLTFRSRARRFDLRLYAAAASILLAAGLGFGGGVAWQRTASPPVFRQPLADVPFRTIFLAGTPRSEGETLAVPSGTEFLLLILNVAEVEPFDEYRLGIERSDGGEVWSGELRRTGQSLSVTWPTSWPAGEYRLRLYGLPDGPDEPLIEYGVRIEYD